MLKLKLKHHISEFHSCSKERERRDFYCRFEEVAQSLDTWCLADTLAEAGVKPVLSPYILLSIEPLSNVQLQSNIIIKFFKGTICKI